MTAKGAFITCLVVAGSLVALAGCSHADSAQTVHEMCFRMDGVSEIAISYGGEAVAFYESECGELVIREYMTRGSDRYYADVKQDGGRIRVSEGGKPLFKGGFSRYIEVYFPADYHGGLTVTTTDGDIDISGVDLSLSSLRIDSTAGTVRLDRADAPVIHLSSTRGALELGHISGEEIRLETTSGGVACESLSGAVTYTTTSGDIEVLSAAGSGSYRADSSGRMDITYTEVTGDLSFYNKNDGIGLRLPKGLEFEFEAAAKNGAISTSFQEDISLDGRIARGTVGSAPTVTVQAETNNGDIVVRQ